MVTEDIVIDVMTKDFILWRCLHGGPLSPDTIDQWPPDTEMPWERYRARNTPLLRKLTDRYGACAILVRQGDQVIGQLRFYPRAVWEADGAGMLCLQQDHPAGPVDDFAEHDLPLLNELKDRTLEVHCLMVGRPGEARYKRKGIASRMVARLIDWATDNGWTAIQANSFEDIPILYQVTGCAGHTFWEKLGFHLVDRFPHPHLRERDEFVMKIEAQAKSAGIDPDRARDRLVMRLELT
jgi:GNAT superfamily N-acetyltransferase